MFEILGFSLGETEAKRYTYKFYGSKTDVQRDSMWDKTE
jgi:hypothetical protein